MLQLGRSLYALGACTVVCACATPSNRQAIDPELLAENRPAILEQRWRGYYWAIQIFVPDTLHVAVIDIHPDRGLRRVFPSNRGVSNEFVPGTHWVTSATRVAIDYIPRSPTLGGQIGDNSPRLQIDYRNADNFLDERSIHTMQLAYTSRPGDYPATFRGRRTAFRYVLAFDSPIRAEWLDDMLDLVSVTGDASSMVAELVQRLDNEGLTVEWGGVRQTRQTN